MPVELVNAGLNALRRAIFPPICVLCGEEADRARKSVLDLCAGCANDLPLNRNACPFCAEPLNETTPVNSICGQCLQRRPRFNAAFCPYRYAYPIDHLVRALKFHNRLAYGRVLGELLADALSEKRIEPWPDLLIPVPLAKERFRERGFNQAIELGCIIERRLGIPLRPDLVTRVRSTREQTGLDSKARRKNVRGAFQVTSQLAANRIAILDDVITTGSTANELARTLRRAGAKSVEVWAVARTAR
jgi:ComF family protein